MHERSLSGVHRCSICNKVNVPDISTDLGDYDENGSFSADPANSMFDICIDCQESINDVLYDFEMEDLYAEMLEKEKKQDSGLTTLWNDIKVEE